MNQLKFFKVIKTSGIKGEEPQLSYLIYFDKQYDKCFESQISRKKSDFEKRTEERIIKENKTIVSVPSYEVVEITENEYYEDAILGCCCVTGEDYFE